MTKGQVLVCVFLSPHKLLENDDKTLRCQGLRCWSYCEMESKNLHIGRGRAVVFVEKGGLNLLVDGREA